LLVLAVCVLAGGLVLCSVTPPVQAAPGGQATLDNAEAARAFTFLNQVRANPAAYSSAFGVDLSGIGPRPQLTWNKNLAQAAQNRALDMAQRNYFSHTTPEGLGINVLINRAGYTLPAAWLQPPSLNYFESIDGGAPSGKDAIRLLIVDQGVPDLGHRKHLLGLTPFWADCLDAGIGFARNPNSTFGTYVCVIIAKHR
jgi:uncharacterized protein YkwD